MEGLGKFWVHSFQLFPFLICLSLCELGYDIIFTSSSSFLPNNSSQPLLPSWEEMIWEREVSWTSQNCVVILFLVTLLPEYWQGSYPSIHPSIQLINTQLSLSLSLHNQEIDRQTARQIEWKRTAWKPLNSRLMPVDRYCCPLQFLSALKASKRWTNIPLSSPSLYAERHRIWPSFYTRTCSELKWLCHSSFLSVGGVFTRTTSYSFKYLSKTNSFVHSPSNWPNLSLIFFPQ